MSENTHRSPVELLSMAREHYERERDYAKKQITEFAAELDKNPAYAFEWGNNAVKYAGQWYVAAALAEWLKPAEGEEDDDNAATSRLDVVVNRVREELLRSARSAIPHSTSAMSNLMEQAKIEAWAAAASDDFGGGPLLGCLKRALGVGGAWLTS